MFLPDEIINLILSYREINPVALLIRQSIKDLNGSIFDCYYKNALMDNKKTIHLKNISRLDRYREDRCRVIKSKKLTKEMRSSRNNKIFNNDYNKREEYRYQLIKFYNKLSGLGVEIQPIDIEPVDIRRVEDEIWCRLFAMKGIVYPLI